ncbi:hypothetical protein KF4_061 [Vibrio phage vB_VpaS_KF4]|nr:hypothetical protein KF4_061 [Vibrio phage vB_VpaS_KF4]
MMSIQTNANHATDRHAKPSEQTWKPKFHGEVEGYVMNWVRNNHWKVNQQLPDVEDVKQEAYLIFLYVADKYPNIDNPRWFMDMFKRTFGCRMIDCSRKQIRHKEHFTETDVLLSEGEESLSLTEMMVGDLETSAIAEKLMEEADGEVKQVLRTLLNMPAEVFTMVEEAWTSRGKRKVLGNQMLCALLGKDPNKTDLVKKVEDHFIG